MCCRLSNSFGGLEDGEEEDHDKFLQLRKQKEQLQKQVGTEATQLPPVIMQLFMSITK